jgi:hypothetical protein
MVFDPGLEQGGNALLMNSGGRKGSISKGADEVATIDGDHAPGDVARRVGDEQK